MSNNEKDLIYLADLTHTGPVISSNVHPLAVGLIGACLLEKFHADLDVELFKYPSDLSKALGRRLPRIVGFSNYSWNCNLSYEFARRIKEMHAETVIVFGGPNYGLTEGELAAFWERYPLIDFYVVKEGEHAMVGLVEALGGHGYDVEALRASETPLPNCHYLWKGELVCGDYLPRVKDLSELPSPYTTGLMDKFFDGVLAPMIHTTRGCPFTCTFCSEGAQYYNKVVQRSGLEDELEYIAQRVGDVPDLFLSDANFGMFKQDIEKARAIARVQEKHGWPKRLVVSTGKNRKERILEVASMLNGALNITAALQSTNEVILDKIKRSNISIDALNVMTEHSKGAGADTYSELILGLPGDSVEAHRSSLRDVITANLGMVRMYQLIMLPQTELNTDATRQEYGMVTKYRIMPRSIGEYELFGEKFAVIESEEICVANNTLSFDEYVQCREMDFTVEILHNTGMFSEVQRLCWQYGLSWFDLMMRFHANRREYHARLAELYEQFARETREGLWDSRVQLEEHVEQNIELYVDDDHSTNEMANSKAVAFFHLQEILHEAIYGELAKLLEERGLIEKVTHKFLQELKTFSLYRKQNILDADVVHSGEFHFDFPSMARSRDPIDPESYALDTPVRLDYCHSEEQARMTAGYVNQYGTSPDGLTRIVMRVPLKKIYREVVSVSGVEIGAGVGHKVAEVK